MAEASKDRTAREGTLRETIASLFTRVEDVVYVCLGVLLAVSAGTLLVSASVKFVAGLSSDDLAGLIVGLLDQLLLVLLIVEILYTVQVSFREHTLVPEPFLIVGLIAAIRRVLLVTAEFSHAVGKPEVSLRNGMIELGLLSLLIVALVASLVLLQKRSPAAHRS